MTRQNLFRHLKNFMINIWLIHYVYAECLYLRRAWRYQRGNQNPYIEEEQTTQWPKEKVQKGKQRSTKHTYITKDRVTRTPLKTGGELRCSGRVASYLDLHLEIDSEGWLRTKLYDKRDDFNFSIVNFPFICSNIPAAPAYGVYISQLIRYSRACGSYQDFLDRGLLLTGKLLNQGSS
jgi:hypothetical protein